MAICKKSYGNDNSYHKVFKKHIPEETNSFKSNPSFSAFCKSLYDKSLIEKKPPMDIQKLFDSFKERVKSMDYEAVQKSISKAIEDSSNSEED